MKKNYEFVVIAALSLGDTDRARLRSQLQSQVDHATSPDDVHNEELIAELERRNDDYLRDPSGTVSWEVFRQKMVEKYL